MKTLHLLSLILVARFAFCQTHLDSLSLTDNKVFTVVEVMPEYPGGEQALLQFMKNEVHYPDYELDHNIQGRVVVGFTVNEYGHIEDIKIKKSVSPGVDSEALRVTRLLSHFKPGRQEGKAVRVSYILPTKFSINNPSKSHQYTGWVNGRYGIYLIAILYPLLVLSIKYFLKRRREQKPQ